MEHARIRRDYRKNAQALQADLRRVGSLTYVRVGVSVSSPAFSPGGCSRVSDAVFIQE
jgi:hypothetical protein